MRVNYYSHKVTHFFLHMGNPISPNFLILHLLIESTNSLLMATAMKRSGKNVAQ